MSELVLVTGAAGFIGSNLCDALLAAGYRVRGADNYSTGNSDNLATAKSSPHFEFFEADVSSLDACRSLCDGVAAVLHHAALASVPASMADPARSHRDTATSTVNLLAAAHGAGARRFVFASSAACYGEHDQAAVREDFELRPVSPYAAAKISGEFYVRAFAAMGLDGVSLRYFNAYGPRHRPDSGYAAVIPVFARRLLKGEPVTLFGDGLQTRDFIHVSDIARANLLALGHNSPLRGAALNIASGQHTTLLELIEKLASLNKCKAGIDHQPAREGDIKHSLADTSLAAEVLGFRAEVGLEAGLGTVVEWMRSALI